MRLTIFALLGAILLAGAGPASAQDDAPRPPSAYRAAIADNHRPAKDKARDADRKPAELLSFIGVKPGDQVVDLMPGGGYFTRLFSSTVGSTGRVYAVEPTEMSKAHPEGLAALRAITADAVYGNVVVANPSLADSGGGQAPPQPLDLVFTSQNYHDLHDKFLGPVDVAAFNKAVFKALKPGGVFVVLDHAAAPASGLAATDTLHRIDPEAVRQEVTAAGFSFEGESPVLRNAADDHSKNVFDKSVRGRTDQFILKFRKPAR